MVKYRYNLNRTHCSPLSLTVYSEWASLSWQWCVVRINAVVIQPQSHMRRGSANTEMAANVSSEWDCCSVTGCHSCRSEDKRQTLQQKWSRVSMSSILTSSYFEKHTLVFAPICDCFQAQITVNSFIAHVVVSVSIKLSADRISVCVRT